MTTILLLCNSTLWLLFSYLTDWSNFISFLGLQGSILNTRQLLIDWFHGYLHGCVWPGTEFSRKAIIKKIHNYHRLSYFFGICQVWKISLAYIIPKEECWSYFWYHPLMCRSFSALEKKKKNIVLNPVYSGETMQI